MASNKQKAALAVGLLLVAGGLAYSRMQKFTPSAAINNGTTEDWGGPAQQAEFKEMAKQANITPEQQKKLDTAREKGDWGAMRDILTTDQRTMMFQQFRQRRAAQDQKMKAALGSQYDRYQQKRQELRGRWGGGAGGRGGNRPGGGGQGGPGGPR